MKVLIVDDEPKVRQHLHDLIEQTCDGYEVVGNAENGSSALACFERLHPDIVMTDIRMPGMNGLTLLEELNRKHYILGCVILSGYDDFAYTQQAMRQGVQNYLLKPVDPKELYQALQRAAEELQQKRTLDHLLKKGQIACRGRWLLNLLHGISIDNTFAEAQTFGLAFTFENCTLYLIDLADNGESDEPFSTGWQNQWQSDTCVLAVAEHDRIAILRQGGGAVADCARTLLDRLKTDHPRAVIACSDPITSATEARMQYLHLKQLLDNRWLIQGSDVLNARQWFDDSWTSVSEWKYDALDAAIERSDEAEIRRQTELFFATMVNGSPQMLRALFAESVLHPMRVIFDNGGNVYDALGEQLNLDELLGRMSFSELRDWYYQLCLRISGYLTQMRTLRPKRVSDRILALFNEDCAHDYSLDALAGIFYMSAAYLSEVFKRETGKTVHAFLTEIRIAQSCRLLCQTDAAVYEIAEKVGYPNLRSYFTAFKKCKGCTPGQYREGGK